MLEDQVAFPLVSIIITTKNEEKCIENCIKSIKAQTYPFLSIEIIVVDNFSTDSTKEISERYTDKVYERGPERSAQRNYGMLHVAKGEYVMYVDADMTLSPSLVTEAVRKMHNDESLVGVYIPLRWVGGNWIVRCKGFEREFYDASILDAVRFVSRGAFLDAGGFDERLYGGEDWDLDRRIGRVGKLDSITSEMYHYEDCDITLKKYLRKMMYYAPNLDIYIQKWGKADPIIRKQFGLIYRYFFVFLENGKWRIILKHPFLAVGMYWLKILVGIVFSSRRVWSRFSKNPIL